MKLIKFNLNKSFLLSSPIDHIWVMEFPSGGQSSYALKVRKYSRKLRLRCENICFNDFSGNFSKYHFIVEKVNNEA